jgi:hypothetical protein
MDAKILKAAISAAIRVTVSTTVIGCGGSVTTDAGGASGPSAAGSSTHATTGGNASTKSTDDQAAYPYPVAQPESGGTGNDAPTATGGSPVGNQTGGMTNAMGGLASAGTATGGEAGEPAVGGAASEVCGGAIDACLTSLEKLQFGDSLTAANLHCCKTALDGLMELQAAAAECYWPLDSRFLSMPAHQQCCVELDAWQQSACTPWGPPVPPELALDTLIEWEAAA